VAPKSTSREPSRTTIGRADFKQPYNSSVLNISGMSFGAFTPKAIRALNGGAEKGNFADASGEGSVSRHHTDFNGDRVWQIGSGYFGCRNEDGSFTAERFADTAKLDQIKIIEIKLSQGVKPGRGGVLPAAKINEEISRARCVPMGWDGASPACRRVFSTPIELTRFVKLLRELAEGKPVWIMLCLGHPLEFMSLVKAILVASIAPDFIAVDGNEGGRHRCCATGVRRSCWDVVAGWSLVRAQRTCRCGLAGPDPGWRQRKNRFRFRYGLRDGAWCRLLQCGAGLYVRRRLHPRPVLSLR